MKQILLTTVLSLSFATATVAQEKLWTLDVCMRYAVENSPSVKSKFIHQIRIRRNGMPP